MTVKICEWCGFSYVPDWPNQRYCKRKCRINARREKTRLRVHKFRKRWGYVNKNDNGSGKLGPHRNPNENKEKELIQAEKRRLGLHF